MDISRVPLCVLVMGLCASHPGLAADRGGASMLARQIDEQLAEAWRADQIRPAAPADDAEFLRRVYLDLTGRIPRVSEVRAFLRDRGADKRADLIDELLDSPRHHAHFARLWSERLVSNGNAPDPAGTAALQEWLRRRFSANEPFDQIAGDLLKATTAPRARDAESADSVRHGPLAFYRANQMEPPRLAASASRLFLGLRLECAQCHDHPFAQWKQKQFWQLAAFFTEADRQSREVAQRPVIPVADSERTVTARFPDGKAPPIGQGGPREALVEWMTKSDNPYFAQATVNQLWSHFFGFGLVDPPDDFRAGNPPSHPKVLRLLARAFVRSGYDRRFITRAITTTRAYHLSSAATDPSQSDPRQFARMTVKGLTADQLFDSLALAVGYAEPAGASSAQPDAVDSARRRFLNRFGGPARVIEPRTSGLQALMLMNGEFTADATGPAGNTLNAVAEASFLDTREKIEAIYLASLSRPPRPGEAKRLVAFVKSRKTKEGSTAALADVFWALLNSSEFALNH